MLESRIVVIQGHEIQAKETCPHFDGTVHDGRLVAETHDDRKVRSLGDTSVYGKSARASRRTTVALMNQANNHLDREIQLAFPPLTLAQLSRAWKKK